MFNEQLASAMKQLEDKIQTLEIQIRNTVANGELNPHIFELRSRVKTLRTELEELKEKTLHYE